MSNQNSNLLLPEFVTREQEENQQTVHDILRKKKTLSDKDKKLKKYTWGIGLEHEMQYFHLPSITTINPNKDKIEDTIIFNTLDGTISLVEDKRLNILDKDFLESIPFETTGRKCNGIWVLKKTPVAMPEFVTKVPFSNIKKPLRMVDYYRELLDYEWKFSRLLNLDKKVSRQSEKYGTIVQYPYGMSNYIKLAKNYNVLNYKFEKDLITDYLGSFHVTITLPFEKKKTYTEKDQKKFIDMHQNFANMFQWLEPLLLCAFFSSDQKAVGTNEKRIRGSYRVMRIGWGNLAGSDVRKLNEGVGRYADIDTYWREGLDFYEINKLKPCYKPNPKLGEKTAVSSLSSDIRTFGSTDPKRPWHRESGAPMSIPNGIEIRIFDHFETIFFISLLRIISLIAANSYVTKTNKYVYQNKNWIDTIHKVMEDGWRAEFTQEYKKELETQLGIKIKKKVKSCYKLLEEVVKALWEKNKNSDIFYMLDGNNKDIPNVPNINKGSWDLGFILKCSNNPHVFSKFKKLYKNLSNTITKDEYKKLYRSIFKDEKWEKNCMDIFYFMLEKNMIVKQKENIYKKNKDWEEYLPYILNYEVVADFLGFNMRQKLPEVLNIENANNEDTGYFSNLFKRLNKKYKHYDKYVY